MTKKKVQTNALFTTFMVSRNEGVNRNDFQKFVFEGLTAEHLQNSSATPTVIGIRVDPIERAFRFGR